MSVVRRLAAHVKSVGRPFVQWLGWPAPAHLSPWLLLRLMLRRVFRIGLVLGLLEAVGLIVLTSFRRFKPQSKRIVFPHQSRPPVIIGEHELTIYDYGEDAFRAMFADIKAARDCVLVETYQFNYDEVGNTFRKRLIRQAQRGVRVYLIFDSIGSWWLPARLRRFPRNIRSFEFGPIKSLRTLVKQGVLVRDHRKILVVDSEIAYLGGINIGKEYRRRWRDTHLRIVGPLAQNVAQAFGTFWDAYHPDGGSQLSFSPTTDPKITIVANDPLRGEFPIHDCYLEAFNKAEHSIRIASSYFLPPRTLIDALTAAARRGVKVELLVPDDSDVPLVDWAARNLFAEFLMHGVTIWMYQRTVNHSKTCTIDGRWSTIGSANLDSFSLRGNFEINAFICDEAFAAQMEAMWENDLRNCIRLDPATWAYRSPISRLAELLARPLIPYL
jgi:cardiolipin synthase